MLTKNWKNGAVSIRELIRLAKNLTEDGDGSNPEYSRALIEIIVDAARLPMDDRGVVAKALGIKEVQ